MKRERAESLNVLKAELFILTHYKVDVARHVYWSANDTCCYDRLFVCYFNIFQLFLHLCLGKRNKESVARDFIPIQFLFLQKLLLFER